MEAPHSSGATVEIDRIKKREWEELIQRFDDATIYQTWSYGAIRWGERNLSHAVLKKRGEVIGLAQVTTRKLPLIGAGIAYVPRGPMWNRRGEGRDAGDFAELLRALREEYAIRRGFLLRITPNVIEGEDDRVSGLLAAEDYVLRRKHDRTILLNLQPSLDDLRKRLDRKWRGGLTFSEKSGIRTREGTEDGLYDSLLVPYSEMLGRKKFMPGVDPGDFRAVQRDLPANLKMKILICESDGEPVYSVLFSVLGDRGIFILGGTSNRGTKLKASYLGVWRVIEIMKRAGALWCDLGGYDPVGNPGTAHFKKGLNGRDVSYIGEFEFWTNSLSRWSVTIGERLRRVARRGAGAFLPSPRKGGRP